MRTTLVTLSFVFLCAAACGVDLQGQPGADAGSDAGATADAGPGCTPTAAQTPFLGRWQLSGTVTKNGATWPASFAVDVGLASDCSTVLTSNGDCRFDWAVQSGATTPTLVARGTACEPKAATRFTFAGMDVYDGQRDPFPGVGVRVTLLDAGFAVVDGGAQVSGVGTLGANTGSEAMSFQYTGARP